MSRTPGQEHDQATRNLATLLDDPRVKGSVRVRDQEIRTFTPRPL